MYNDPMENMTPLYSPGDLLRLEKKIETTRRFCWALGIAALIACVVLCLLTDSGNAWRTELSCIALWTAAGWIVLYLRRYTLSETRAERQHARMLLHPDGQSETLRGHVTVTEERLRIIGSIRFTVVLLENEDGTRRLKVCSSRAGKLRAAGETWLILSAVFWGFVFNFVTDAPAEKKLVLFAEVEQCEDQALSARLEEGKPDGIRLVQAHSFNYVLFDEAGLLNADLYIVGAESVGDYRDSFAPLDLTRLNTEGLTLLELDGKPCGIRVWDGQTGSAGAYLGYGAGEYYLFIGANSVHAGRKDCAAYWMIDELLKLP